MESKNGRVWAPLEVSWGRLRPSWDGLGDLKKRPKNAHAKECRNRLVNGSPGHPRVDPLDVFNGFSKIFHFFELKKLKKESPKYPHFDRLPVGDLKTVASQEDVFSRPILTHTRLYKWGISTLQVALGALLEQPLIRLGSPKKTRKPRDP